MNLIQLDSGYFCAAVELNESGVVTVAAPILKYMRGWKFERVVSYATFKRWKITFIGD